jgi:hypothetical protein
MHLPASTGEVAQFLGVTEPRLNDLIRRARIDPVPPIAAGRRCWLEDHILAAAAASGLDVAEVRLQLAGAPAGPEAP